MISHRVSNSQNWGNQNLAYELENTLEIAVLAAGEVGNAAVEGHIGTVGVAEGCEQYSED